MLMSRFEDEGGRPPGMPKSVFEEKFMVGFLVERVRTD